MSGSIKVGGHTVFVHTGASGAGTLSVQGQNGNVLLSDDGTAVSLGNNVRLPASGGIKDSSGNNILTESGGNVSVGNIRLPASGGIKDSSGNNILTESGGTVTFGNVIGGVPAGAIMSFAMNSPPSGWVICNGAEYAIADYGDLHTAIGTTWGALTNGSGGAGSTHFRVPDLRGEFLRGVDSGRGLDSNRVFASTVSDNVKQFQGWVEAPAYADYSSCFKAADGTIFTLSTQVTYGPSYDSNAAQGPRYTRATMTIGSGSETYPKNVAILYCIKY